MKQDKKLSKTASLAAKVTNTAMHYKSLQRIKKIAKYSGIHTKKDHLGLHELQKTAKSQISAIYCKDPLKTSKDYKRLHKVVKYNSWSENCLNYNVQQKITKVDKSRKKNYESQQKCQVQFEVKIALDYTVQQKITKGDKRIQKNY